MKADTWMPLYIADYLRKTMHLTRDQHGGYMLLLMACWDRGGRLPNDPGQLAGIARATSAEWKRLAPVLLPFFEVDGEHLIQARVTEEHAKAARISEARRQAGMQGGRPKKESKTATDEKPNAFPNGKQNETHAGVARPSQSTPPSEVYGDANASPDANAGEGKGARRKPERPIPDGFPAEAEIETATTMAQQAGVVLQVRTEAERFRNHAEQNDRRCRDWAAAWRNWVSKAIERAPKSQVTPSAPSVETMRASWEIRLGQWSRDRYWDEERWGPKPGQPACRVPEDMLPAAGDLFERRAFG